MGSSWQEEEDDPAPPVGWAGLQVQMGQVGQKGKWGLPLYSFLLIFLFHLFCPGKNTKTFHKNAQILL